MTHGTAVYYFGYDGSGSTRFLLNSSGSIASTYDYDAYGNLLASTSAANTAYRFNGEQLDLNLNLYYLRARYYQPTTSRFWSMDSYEGNQTTPNSLHKYLYCAADPVNKVDPSGNEGTFVSTLTAMTSMEGLQTFKAAGDAKIQWEMRAFQQELLNDLNPMDLKRNEKLGYEGEAVLGEVFEFNRLSSHTS